MIDQLTTYTVPSRASEHFASNAACMVAVLVLVPKREASFDLPPEILDERLATVQGPVIDVASCLFWESDEDTPRSLASVDPIVEMRSVVVVAILNMVLFQKMYRPFLLFL